MVYTYIHVYINFGACVLVYEMCMVCGMYCMYGI